MFRTRFAPSPTGFLHIGSLRTALYDFLFTRHNKGTFILRIEDTDQQRYVEGAVETIYRNLRWVGIEWDEGVEAGGNFGPYVQSERKEIYKKYAEELVKKGYAYYCFCSKERLENLRKEQEAFHKAPRYDNHCRNLNKEEIEKRLANKDQYVIRQAIPEEGEAIFDDLVFGKISVNVSELEDQILLKSDGLPTYNFANVVDDHLMEITHIIRGSEFLSSTPKFNLLYDAFGWEKPTYIHLPVITDEKHRKLSKRQGDVAVDDFINKGYTKEAIVNYVALLGWNPGTEKEIFSMEELIKEFSPENIHKSPAIFDYKKLNWLNGYYLRKMNLEDFHKFILPFYSLLLDKSEEADGNDQSEGKTHLPAKLVPLAQPSEVKGPRLPDGIKDGVKGHRPPDEVSFAHRIFKGIDLMKVSKLLHERVDVPADIPEMVDFFFNLPDYDISLYINSKMKTDSKISLQVLVEVIKTFEDIKEWNEENIKEALYKQCESIGIKTSQIMWPVRIALSGKQFTPGGAIEIADILGKEESLRRLKTGLEKLR